MAAGGGGQWETIAANGKGQSRSAVMDRSSGGNGQWRLATTSGGSRCRQTMRAMENDKTMEDEASDSDKQQQTVVDGVAVSGSQCRSIVAINSSQWLSAVVSNRRQGMVAADDGGQRWQRMVVDDGGGQLSRSMEKELISMK